jgi:AcrR family transcriptional regulator
MPKIIHDADVFQAVSQVLLQRGYAGATMRHMAAAAGVSEVTLFRKYGSKSDLVLKTIMHIADEMDFEAATHYTGDVRADLLRIVGRYQIMISEYGELLSLLLPEVRRHPELQPVMGRLQSTFQLIGELLVHYQRAGVLQTENPVHAVAALLGPLAYAAMVEGGSLGEQPLMPEASHHVDRFLHGRIKQQEG